ncbi:hypothetical protein GCM10020331_069290 [Ectobacillus funiculus]
MASLPLLERNLEKPDELVVAIVGDAGFQMTLQELSVLKDHDLPVKNFDY